MVPPTPSVERAARLLETLPVGGRTPLGAGLVEVGKVLSAARRRDPLLRPLVVLLTDGRANRAFDPSSGDAPAAEARAIAEKWLDRVGLAARTNHYPGQLSGGQQQRVAIARALATDPEIIYFDEPTSALDPELTGEVLAVMRQLAEEGMTMLVVTHEMGFARNVSSKTVFMENGVVVEQAPSREFFEDPKEERTREFLRKIEHTN